MATIALLAASISGKETQSLVGFALAYVGARVILIVMYLLATAIMIGLFAPVQNAPRGARLFSPDQGIWEIRDQPRHFTHSKANCWLALHRGLQLAQLAGMPCDTERWAAERDKVRAFLIQQAAPAGWFQQAAGHPVPDASTLLLPAIGFLPTTDPLVLETMSVVRRSLERDGLLYRYLSPDGLAGGEGAFLLCSFWLIDCLTHAGQLAEAEELLGLVLGCANDVGLLSEEVDAATGEALGNFPQAFSHMALVTSCAHLSAAQRGQIPGGPADYAELALDRLLSGREPRD